MTIRSTAGLGLARFFASVSIVSALACSELFGLDESSTLLECVSDDQCTGSRVCKGGKCVVAESMGAIEAGPALGPLDAGEDDELTTEGGSREPMGVEPEPVVEPAPSNPGPGSEPEPMVVEPEPMMIEPEPMVVEPEPMVIEPEPSSSPGCEALRCDENALCRSSAGDVFCECRGGYEGDGQTCSDIDECQNPDTCSQNAVCADIDGSYRCDCGEGWQSDGFACDPICGDGVVVSGEQCDDGNTTGGDGCSDDCTAVASGFDCGEAGSQCQPICGDGLLRGAEVCDDGNVASGDGCSGDCGAVEQGYRCPTPGMTCSAFGVAKQSCDGLGEICVVDGQPKSCCSSIAVGGDWFAMGTPATVATAPESEKPEHSVWVSPFELDEFEVTVGRFRRFLEDYSEPPIGAAEHPLIPGSGWQDDPLSFSLPATATDLVAEMEMHCGADMTWSDDVAGAEALPINCVLWDVGFAFCAWDGGRLPTEAEWEFAAAGGAANLAYPWGNNEPTSEHANYFFAFAGPIAVGSKPSGASVFGHQDLMGNVAEWVRDGYDETWYGAEGNACEDCANLTTGFQLTRGGSFASLAPAMCGIGCMTPTSRGWGSTVPSYNGLRCARGVEP